MGFLSGDVGHLGLLDDNAGLSIFLMIVKLRSSILYVMIG
jgi:hypothetical protein